MTFDDMEREAKLLQNGVLKGLADNRALMLPRDVRIALAAFAGLAPELVRWLRVVNAEAALNCRRLEALEAADRETIARRIENAGT